MFKTIVQKEVSPFKQKKDREKNKEVKDQILQAARLLFSKKGYDGTTVRQICEEANVSLALISYHFGGKESVFYEIFEPIRHTFMNMNYDLSNSLEALSSFCRHFVLFRIEHHELINILQQELVMNSSRLDMLKDVFWPSWDQLQIILEECKKQHTIDFPSVEVAVNFIMGTLMFSYNNPFLNRSQPELSADMIADLAVQYIIKGLQTAQHQ